MNVFKERKKILLLFLLLIGAFLRFYRLPELMTYLGDEGRDMLIVKDIIEKSDYIINEVIPRNQLFKNFPLIDILAYTYNPNIDYWDKNHPTKFFEYIGSEIPFIATKCGPL